MEAFLKIDEIANSILTNFTPDKAIKTPAEMIDRLIVERETVTEFNKRALILVGQFEDLDDYDSEELRDYVRKKSSELLLACHNKRH